MNINYDYLAKIRRAVSLYTRKKTSNILDGDFFSLHRGRSMDFDDLKEYSLGDDVHDIDWKSSSRFGTILVRRYMTDRRHNVMFICDRGAKFQGDTGTGESKEQLMLMAFGTLAYIVGRNGADFALAYPGNTSANISLFRSGQEHLEKLLYTYGAVAATEGPVSLHDTIEDMLNIVQKRMIIFLLTDREGLASLNEGIIRSLTDKNDLLIINIEDAFLTDNGAFDNETGMYEKLFLSHNKKLREEELRNREDILNHMSDICKRNEAAIGCISSEHDIIGCAIDLLERYRHGYYG